MLNYDCFLKNVTQLVKDRVSGEHQVEVNPVRKNNGVMLDCLTIRRPDEWMCPNVYLNQLYSHYLKGMSMEEVVANILAVCQRTAQSGKINADELINPKVIRQNVVYRLVNYDRNSSLLKEVPHKRFLDLALIYYVMVSNEALGEGAVMVQNHFLEHYDLRMDEIDDAAKRNTGKLLPADFVRITDLLREFGEKSGACSYSDISMEEESAQSPLYVLTNRPRQFGAYYLTDTEVLSDISRKLESDLYILPSSVHECMVVPVSIWEDVGELAGMVREINSTQVSEDEYLADTVYRFRRKEKRVLIAS